MNSEKITIVTGFFDCARGVHKTQKRTNDDYLSYFAFWAGLKNKVIIYTYSEMKEKVLEIRKNSGRENATEVIVIDDVWSIEKNILDKMESVEQRGEFKKWRFFTEDISNEARYDYIMLMKYWFMKDAVERGFAQDGCVAWLDFGWNHGGVYYSDSSQFCFEWKYPFENTIHLFTRKDIEKELGFVKLQNMRDSIMGTVIVNASKASLLYNYVIEAMCFLLSIDCFDDDQMLLRIVAKLHPDDCIIHDSDWYLPIKQYGNPQLTVVEKSGKVECNEFAKKSKFSRVREIIEEKHVKAYILWRVFKCIKVESYELKEYDLRINDLLSRYDN